MQNIKIYYFSGTGNTYAVAKAVKQTFDSHQYNCSLENIENCKEVCLSNIDCIGLLFPVAIQSTFPNVWNFIYNLPKCKNTKAFMIDTMNQSSGGIVGPVKRVLQKKGYLCIGALEVKMTNSMATKMSSTSMQIMKNEKAIKRAKDFTEELIREKTKWKRVPVFSDIMRSLSCGKLIWRFTSKLKTIDDSLCTNCQLCVKNCPTGALSYINNSIQIDHSLCISCMRCANSCPQNAFLLNKKKIVQNKFIKEK